MAGQSQMWGVQDVGPAAVASVPTVGAGQVNPPGLLPPVRFCGGGGGGRKIPLVDRPPRKPRKPRAPGVPPRKRKPAGPVLCAGGVL